MTAISTWPNRKLSLRERFWAKVTKSSYCWTWNSAIGHNGYGMFWIGRGVSRYAHRVAYELCVGSIPEGMLVMHSCDNPQCVNPEHLSIGTNSDNLLDASRKGRIARGERNGGGRKLTAKQVATIKSSQTGCTTLARIYSVSSQTIKAIRHGRIWKHIQS